MKKYFIPETTCLTVNAQAMICASANPTPGRSGQLGTMTITEGSWI